MTAFWSVLVGDCARVFDVSSASAKAAADIPGVGGVFLMLTCFSGGVEAILQSFCVSEPSLGGAEAILQSFGVSMSVLLLVRDCWDALLSLVGVAGAAFVPLVVLAWHEKVSTITPTTKRPEISEQKDLLLLQV